MAKDLWSAAVHLVSGRIKCKVACVTPAMPGSPHLAQTMG